MDDVSRAFKDMTAMIASERDARRGDVREMRAHLKALDRRMAEGDERSTRFEGALLVALSEVGKTIAEQVSAHEVLEERVSALERWRRDQAS